MTTESSSDEARRAGELDRRVRLHAALGDAARLGIADRLSLSDASPGELAAAFGLPSNLLAHHLRVLEQAGIVRRVRSEGDRRRSYVQLVHDDPVLRGLLRPALPAAAERVVFVCTKNSARSQLAAAAWQQASDIPAASAGTHPADQVNPRAVAVGRQHGLRIPRTATHHVRDVLRPRDLVVAVCDNAHEELPGLPSAGGPDTRLHWAVPDPVRIDTDEAFEAAYQQITARIDHLATALNPTDHHHRSGSRQ
jgi:protein-tyrosine-phosphatase/DNA-binding transcriptional ArsR family regulator